MAVLGAGIMGSRIACHFANAGVEVLLLDRPDASAVAASAKDSSASSARNRLVNEALEAARKSNPPPLYRQDSIRLIRTGNFEDDLSEISSADWILEAIVENLEIKRALLEQVAAFRLPGSLVTSNTSGIPLQLISKGMPDEFQAHFCGTHFFNPPRYLPLLEIIPGPRTDRKVIDFLLDYGDRYLGKTTIRCKDTPAFIANRIGVFSIMNVFHAVEKTGLSVEEVDQLTGPLLGRPKSATFRTADLVGLDTLAHVARGLYEQCPDDEQRELFRLPAFLEKMLEQNRLGSKTGEGFYKKVRKEAGGSEIQALGLDTLEYGPSKKTNHLLLEAARAVDSLDGRLKLFVTAEGKAGAFFRDHFFGLFSYCSRRIPEISDQLYRIDEVMKAGFGWEKGPFEMWDALGVAATVKAMEESGYQPAGWVLEMLQAGHSTFYTVESGRRQYYSIPEKSSVDIPGASAYLSLELLKREAFVWGNNGVTLTDLGQGILNCEFHTKMNTLGGDLIEGLNKAVTLAEKDFEGLVIANEGAEFSVGANLSLVLMHAVEQEWDEIDFLVRTFQKTMLRLRYSTIPVVAAPHNRALGGGCELCLHADYVQAHAELYMGLVEFGVGIIPAGGGTKEFARRAAEETSKSGIDELDALKSRYMTIATAQVSTSAWEAVELGYLDLKNAAIGINRKRQLLAARTKARELADTGYQPPVPENIRVLGRLGLGMFTVGASNMAAGNQISEHDGKIAEKLAWVICGGDLTAPSEVSEQYLLNLEREAFLSLCGERKTLERMQSILRGGKVLRN